MSAARDRSAARPTTRLLFLARIVVAIGIVSGGAIRRSPLAPRVRGAWIGILTALGLPDPLHALITP